MVLGLLLPLLVTDLPAAAAPARSTPIIGALELVGGRELDAGGWLAGQGIRIGAPIDTLGIDDMARRLEAACLEEGYLDVRVSIRWTMGEWSAAGESLGTGVPPLDLQVEVATGPLWRFGDVRHTGADSAVAAAMSRGDRPEPGRPYRTSRVEADLERWLDAYDAAGFAYARVRPVRVAADSGRIDLAFRHDPGPRVRLTGIDLEGATVTKPATVERLLGFEAGQLFQSDALRHGLERLRASGCFLEVGEAELLPESDPSRARLRIPVREAPSGSLSGIIGYSGLDQRFAGQLDFRLRSIAGTGRQLRARWSGQTLGTTLYQLNYREPALLGWPVDGVVAVEHLLFDTLYVRTRFEAGVAWQPRGPLEIAGAIGEDRTVVTAGVNRTHRSLRWRGSARYDRRDGLLAPMRGYRMAGEIERGQAVAGTYGDEATGEAWPLTRVLLEGKLLVPLPRRQGIAFNLLGRSLRTAAQPVPQYELFPLGGANTLRGYREEQFYTPVFLLGQIEYRVGVTPDGGGAYLFVDGAGLADAESSAADWPRMEFVKVGYGAGLRVTSRLGRVGVDYGLATGEGPLDGRIHLRLESEF